jgi:hypothetical protein
VWENLGLDVPVPITPKAMNLPRMTLKQPVPDVPAYKPMIIPPSDLEAPEGVKAEAKEKTEQPEVRKLDIPVLDIEFPLPSGEIVATAVTTAVVAVATTTVAQTFFEPIQKQVKKQLQKRVDAWKKKRQEKISSTS